MQAIPIYARTDSPRLRYVLNWVLSQRLSLPFQLITGNDHVDAILPGISYGFNLPGCLNIPDSVTLGGRSPYVLNADEWLTGENDQPFAGFDVFSAIFYLLSRMEEWESVAEDVHGRYPHTESILFKAGLLSRPVVDEWVDAIRQNLEKRCRVVIARKDFQFRPTYDIDMAWAYRYKGALRNTGGAVRDIFRGRWTAAGQRLKTMCVPDSKDPYDSFARLHVLHEAAGIKPRWFILAAAKPSRYDKNAPPRQAGMRRLIRTLSQKGEIGLHPSYFSEENETVFGDEKAVLEEISGQPLTHSRQHFLRCSIRNTPRFLIHQGITDDYTMGYAGTTGFRAGTSHSFPWYDLEAEKDTALTLHPFAFMDSAAHFYEKISADHAMQKLDGLTSHLRDTGGILTTVFHNYSLGTDKEWNGWWEGYERFVKRLSGAESSPAEFAEYAPASIGQA